MQVNSFDEVLEKLKRNSYEIKLGKYVSVKPQDGEKFIRLKNLGENYSEQAIRNRLFQKTRFETEVNDNIKNSKPGTLKLIIQQTVRQYTTTFAHGVLPVRKKNKKRPFEWTNSIELDRLAELNKKINSGTTLAILQNDFTTAKKNVTDSENKIATLKTELEKSKSTVQQAIESAIRILKKYF